MPMWATYKKEYRYSDICIGISVAMIIVGRLNDFKILLAGDSKGVQQLSFAPVIIRLGTWRALFHV